MTFRIELKVGDQVLRTALAQKHGPSTNGAADHNEKFIYNWLIYKGTASANALIEGPIAKGQVVHRYGDGVEMLAALIMGDYARIKGSDHP